MSGSKHKWTDSERELAKQYYEEFKHKYSKWKLITNKLTRELGFDVSKEAVRQVVRDNNPSKRVIIDSKKQDTLVSGDVSSRVIAHMMYKHEYTDEELLKLHGLDSKTFKIKTVGSNEWTVTTGKGKRYYNYQSKITAEPIKEDFDWEGLIEHLEMKKKPYEPQENRIKKLSDRYLVIPIFDAHFNGQRKYDYKEMLERTLDIIERDYYKKVMIILGGDLIHIDSVNSTTTKGTQLETTPIDDAIDDAEWYVESIIESLLKHAKEISVVGVPGNHDATSGYLFQRLLKRAYKNQKNIHFNIELKNSTDGVFKAELLGNNFIGVTHGDKARKDAPMIFATQFTDIWCKAVNKEYFTGHLHKELTNDEYGILQRQMSTGKPNDTYEKVNGYVMSSHRFQVIEYSKNETLSVNYV